MSSELISFFSREMKESPVPWWEWDIVRNRVTFNPLKVTMLGYSVADFLECGYETFTHLLHPDDYPAVMKAMQDYLDGTVSLYKTDYRIRDSHGHYRWYMDRGVYSETDSTGKPLRMRGVVLDLGAQVEKPSDIPRVKAFFQSPAHSNFPVKLCVQCGALRIDESTWCPIQSKLVKNLTGRRVSHTLCPDCFAKLYPDFAQKKH
ncbi:MAG: PAS domain-containing protein [Fibrobacterota bacterium]